MINLSERTFGRLPHTNQQLFRGSIGLLVGGLVALLTGLVAYLLDAPVWVEAGLGGLSTLAFAAAIVIPAWYWIVQPVVRGNTED